MSSISNGSGPYNCGGANNPSRSPDLSPREEEIIQKIRKEAEGALQSALVCCGVCGYSGEKCPLNKPVKQIEPKNQSDWEKVLGTAIRKLKDLAKGNSGENVNVNSYDYHPEDPSSNSHNHEENNGGNPNAYNG